MSATRLSALDASFLAVESATSPMHVGWVATFDAPRPGFAALREHIAARLEDAPRYRQKLGRRPLGLHEPMWVDDPEFIRRPPPARPGGDLGAIVDAILSSRCRATARCGRSRSPTSCRAAASR